MTLVLAHSSHWLESVIYLIPIVGFAVWLGVTSLKDRRERRGGEGGHDGTGTTP